MKIVSLLNSIASRRSNQLRATASLLAISLAAITSVRAAQAPPHNISAINLNVVQNDSGNTEASVTVSSTLEINDMRVRVGSNRGDYNVMIGDSGTNDLADGFILSAIRQNGRYNLDEQSEPFYGAAAFDGNANGYWIVAQDVTSDRAEYNDNVAAAYFRYTNFLSGWARNVTGVNGGTNNLFKGSPGLLLGTHFKGISGGRSRVDLRSLGVYSTNSVSTNTGVLLVNHAKNEGNYALSIANPDGTWEVYVKDNFGSATNPNALEQDPVAFVYVPKTNNNVVSGKFALDSTGTNAVILVHNGNTPSFAITNLAVGRYRLTIPGASPTAGVLITSPEGGYATNFDNIVTYEADGNGWIIEHRDTGVYPPELEACTNEPIASFVYIAAATPGFTVTPTNNLITTEYGLTASFSVVLDLAPTNDVTIDVSSSNPLEGIVSTNSLTFNPTNWNVPQLVTVTGQDDVSTDGNIAYSIILAPAVSTDPNYNGLNPADVSVINVDDEQSGISVTPTSGLVTTESGGTATFNVFLNRAPTDNVVIALSSSNSGEGTPSTNALTFTPLDWNIPQVVTVVGANDFKQDGTKVYTIVTAAAVSSDLNYNGINASDVSAVNLDNDVAGYVWNYTLPVQVVEGATATYSLSLGTQPETNVVITNTSLNIAGGATVSPATLTFTPLDWSTPKVITLTGVDNLTNNPSVAFTVNHQPASTDPIYSQLTSVIPVPCLLIDNEALFTLPSGDCIYGLGMPAIGIDGQASLSDVDAVSYNGGSVTAALIANAQVDDRLEIRNSGTNAGQISFSGVDVSYGGINIGSYTGGIGATPLVVSLNANSSLPAVQQLIRSITFRTATNSSLVNRTLSVTLNDGLGFNGVQSKAVRVGALRMTQYQEAADNGYGQYFGAADIALSQVGNTTPWPLGRTPAPQEGLLIDWPDGGTPNESQVLLRFDDFVGTNYWQVPSNAVIVSADLLVYVNNTGDGGKFFRMLTAWDATNDTWSSLGDGVQADDVEARSVYESQLGVADGSGATGTGMITIGVTPDVQAWVSGETNYGWVIKGWPLMTDGTGFTSSEFSDVSQHPRLRVKWLVPAYSTVSFQQGINDYTNTVDANLSQQNPTLNLSTNLSIGSDYNDAGATNTTQGLVRFDNIIGNGTNQIPPGSLIHSAILELSSVGSDAMGDGGQFFAMLQAWDVNTVTWNTFGGNGVQANGIEAAITPTALAGNSSLNPDVQGTVNSYEVTTDLQAWANGTLPNNGWVILPWVNGSNGWFSRSSKFVSLVDPLKPQIECPRLRVFYTTGVIITPAVIQSLGVSPTQVQVPFTGTAGKTYTILRASAVTGPWGSIGTATVTGGGTATFTDASPLSAGAFYRVVYP
jgi:hypothetical protein